MSRKPVLFVTCNRCPVGRELHATRIGVPFSVGDTRWLIDLCDKCYADLDRDISRWGLMGRPAEPTVRMFGEESLNEARRVAELRSKQVSQDRNADTATPAPEPAPATARAPAIPRTRTIGGLAWAWSRHAAERRQEREVDELAALWAASDPTLIRPGDHPGTEWRVRGGVKVVVDPATMTILTVANNN